MRMEVMVDWLTMESLNRSQSSTRRSSREKVKRKTHDRKFE